MAEATVALRGEEQVGCCLRRVPNCDEPCDWFGPWKNQMLHFILDHKSIMHYHSVIALQPEQPKAVVAYNDMFITYASYHKDDLACVVMHACCCTTPYYYRCTLLSGNNNVDDIQTGIIPTFTKVKKFRSIRKHKDVTRFTPEQLNLRKDLQGNINVLIEILSTDCEEDSKEEQQCSSKPGAKDDTSEEEKSSDDESAASKAKSNSQENMNTICMLKSVDDETKQCPWKGPKGQLEAHLWNVHKVNLEIYGHCSADVERVAPLVSYEFLKAGTPFNLKPPAWKPFDCLANRPANCMINYEPNLCCGTLTQPREAWRYGLPPPGGKLSDAMMWDAFRPPTTMNIPMVWKSVPVTSTYPCHFVNDSSELKQLTVDKCPCGFLSSTGSAPRPRQMAFCALSYAPGMTGKCNWLGSSENLYYHLFEEHQCLVTLDDRILLYVQQPRILCAYGDAFLCYIGYDRGDLVCVAMHACPCSNVYNYRCFLLPGVEGYSKVDGDMRYVVNTCKDYKWLRGDPKVTRFPRAVVQPRRSSSGDISVALKIYPPVEKEEVVPPKCTLDFSELFCQARNALSGEPQPSTSGAVSAVNDATGSMSSPPF